MDFTFEESIFKMKDVDDIIVWLIDNITYLKNQNNNNEIDYVRKIEDVDTKSIIIKDVIDSLIDDLQFLYDNYENVN